MLPKFYIHSLLTQIPALFVSNFLAVGAIGENYSNETYVAPELFFDSCYLGHWFIHYVMASQKVSGWCFIYVVSDTCWFLWNCCVNLIKA